MLEDRYYMRQSPFEPRRSATLMLLIVNAAIFLLQLAVTSYARFPLQYYFALSLDGLAHGRIWQLLTFQFLHGGWLHLILNCWAIFVFGRELEETLGVKKYLSLYLSSGVVGGLVQLLAGISLGGAYAAPVVGASAGAFGLVAAFSTLFPERVLMLLLFFILPIRLPAKYLLWLFGGVALVGIVFPGGSNVAHAAHLGGMICGVLFVRYALHWSWPSVSGGTHSPRVVKAQPEKATFWHKNTPPMTCPLMSS